MVNGHSFQLIHQMAALVRCALVEVCTVAVLLVLHFLGLAFCVFLVLLKLFCSRVVCFCCVRFSFLPRDCLERTYFVSSINQSLALCIGIGYWNQSECWCKGCGFFCLRSQ